MGVRVSPDYAALAASYVEASNQHELDKIMALLDGTACYTSSNVGSYSGVEDIIQMMAGFFTNFPNVRWQVSRYEVTDPLSVSFEFRMTATNAKTGEEIERLGLERIDFKDDGKIIHIEVGPRS